MSPTLFWCSFFDSSSQGDNLRTDKEVCGMNFQEIDIEPNTVLVNHQPDHSASFHEGIGLADRQDAASLHAGQHGIDPGRGGTTDEQDLALVPVPVLLTQVPDHHW